MTEDLTKLDGKAGARRVPKRVSDARAVWLVGDEEPAGETRLSGKNQLTIPAAMVRALGWRPGDALEVTLQGGGIMLARLPQTAEDWASYLRGALRDVPEWADDAKIKAWTRAERDGWDDREHEWDR